MFRVLFPFLIAAGVICSAPALADPLPAPDALMTPSEQALFTDALRSSLSDDKQDLAHILTRLDELLAKVTDPTPFRGYIQLLRAPILDDSGRGPEALRAIDESVRLLPGYSLPLLTAADIYAYSNRPGEGADFLLRASEIDPETVRTMDDYSLFNLMHRLGAASDERRMAAVSDRLLAIGWSGTGLTMRSDLAFQAIKRKVVTGDIAGARALVPELVTPSASYSLLQDKRFEALWPDIERWSGPRLTKQWASYLREARARWLASKDLQAARDYAEALTSAGKSEEIITAFLPLYLGKIDPDKDDDLQFLQADVAGALSRAGRWPDIHKMYAAAEAAWPIGSAANALNLTANDAHYRLAEGDAAGALELFDKSLADAKGRGAEVNIDATASMHGYRACALHELHRDAEAGPSLAIAASTADTTMLTAVELCLGDYAAARRTMIAGLANESTRGEALLMMQKPVGGPCRSAFCEADWALRSKLRADPDVLAQVAKYGRIMAYALNDGAPPDAGELPVHQPQSSPAIPVTMLRPPTGPGGTSTAANRS